MTPRRLNTMKMTCSDEEKTVNTWSYIALHLCKLYKLQSEISMDMAWQDCENPWECSCPHLGGSWDTWPFSCWIVLRVSIITLSCSICGFYSTFNMDTDTLHRIVKFLFCFVKQDRFPLISPNPKPRGLGLTSKSSLTNIVYENMSSSQSVVSIYLLLFSPCLVCFASISVKRSVLVCFATSFYWVLSCKNREKKWD